MINLRITGLYNRGQQDEYVELEAAARCDLEGLMLVRYLYNAEGFPIYSQARLYEFPDTNLRKGNRVRLYSGFTKEKKVRTPDSYVEKYGTSFYSYDCGATYKWYLMQYVNVALEAGATPVLVTPVSRQYFDGKGRITPHHDSKDTSTKTQITRNNAYVEAVRQLAKEKKILLIDGFELTKALYEKAYTDCGNNIEAKELMFEGDSTHNNKLGGFVIAGEFAKEIKKVIPALGPSICHPRNAMGENSNGKLMFTVNQDGKMDCYDPYWQRYEQGVMDSLGN